MSNPVSSSHPHPGQETNSRPSETAGRNQRPSHLPVLQRRASGLATPVKAAKSRVQDRDGKNLSATGMGGGPERARTTCLAHSPIEPVSASASNQFQASDLIHNDGEITNPFSRAEFTHARIAPRHASLRIQGLCSQPPVWQPFLPVLVRPRRCSHR